VSINGRPVNTLTQDGWLLGVIPKFHMAPLQMAPEKRVYLASEQPQTMVAIHSTIEWDLYVVYEARIPTPGSRLSRRF